MQEYRKHGCDAITHFSPVEDHVDCAMFQQKFAALEAFGKCLPDGLLDHPRTGKSYKLVRFGHIYITDGCQTCRYSSGSWIREYRDIGDTHLAHIAQGGAGFGHLHK